MDEDHEALLTLPGAHCLACGHVFAPLQDYGCERCGAFGEQLEARALPAAGMVTSAATVHVHRFPSPPPPFTVAEVALDAGPVIRVLATGELRAGMRAKRGADDADGLPRFMAAERA